VYPATQTGGIHFSIGGPTGAKILKSVKIFCNTFLQGGFTDLDDILHDGGFRG